MKSESTITAELMSQSRLPVGMWEVKITKSNAIPFAGFADHQISSLLKARKQRLNYKIQDVGIARKPFDGFTVEKSPAWCILCYPSPMAPGYTAYAVDVIDWYQERRTCGRKSITKERAKELGKEI